MTHVVVTDNAKDHMIKWIESQQATGIYLTLKKSGCSGLQYELEPVTGKPPGVISQEVGAYSIYIDVNCLQKIQGTEIALEVMSLGQTRLRFHNPQATGWCGCGESFQVNE